MLAAKGMSTRDIADITGWGHSIIAKDLQVSKNGQEASKNGQTSADPDRAVAPDPDRARNEERTAEVAAAAEAEGVTSEPSFDRGPEEKYRIVYADPPWLYYGSQIKDAAAAKHYPLMTQDELGALPVRKNLQISTTSGSYPPYPCATPTPLLPNASAP